MTLKNKLISLFSAFVLVVSIMIIGIYAANNVTVNMGGNITFEATDVYAKVTGTISGAQYCL